MMAYEEILDGCVYFTAEKIRAERNKLSDEYINNIEKALNKCLKCADIIINIQDIE